MRAPLLLIGMSVVIGSCLPATAQNPPPAPQQRAKPNVFRDCESCPEMVVVPAGSFAMGSPKDEEGRFDNEGPQHEVKISRPLAVGRLEVMVDQFAAFVTETGRGSDCPEDVAGAKKWTVLACQDGHAYTAPTGSFVANGFGLHDMHGNLWEWTEDCWHDNYAGAPSDGSAWTTGGDCKVRVLRGGSWGYPPRYLRTAVRGQIPTAYRYVNDGFRVVLTLAP